MSPSKPNQQADVKVTKPITQSSIKAIEQKPEALGNKGKGHAILKNVKEMAEGNFSSVASRMKKALPKKEAERGTNSWGNESVPNHIQVKNTVRSK